MTAAATTANRRLSPTTLGCQKAEPYQLAMTTHDEHRQRLPMKLHPNHLAALGSGGSYGRGDNHWHQSRKASASINPAIADCCSVIVNCLGCPQDKCSCLSQPMELLREAQLL